MHWLYAFFVLIDLINGYKNIYSRKNNNVCLGVCVVVLMDINTFKKIIFSMKRGYVSIFRFVSMPF